MCDNKKLECEKLEYLTHTLIEKRKLKGINFRCIVFVQQRIVAYILAKHLNRETACTDFGMRAGFVAAKKSPITPSIKVTPGDASRCIDNFRSGDINILVATAVIEEVSFELSVSYQIVVFLSTSNQTSQGFDVPEANVSLALVFLNAANLLLCFLTCCYYFIDVGCDILRPLEGYC